MIEKTHRHGNHNNHVKSWFKTMPPLSKATVIHDKIKGLRREALPSITKTRRQQLA